VLNRLRKIGDRRSIGLAHQLIHIDGDYLHVRHVPFAVVRITHQKAAGEGLHIRLVTIHAAEDQSRVAEPLPGNGSVHCEVRPPSMIQLQPVIDVADGPNKKATKSATSSTVMNLFTRKRSNIGWTTI
jgi:hypothetical protein